MRNACSGSNMTDTSHVHSLPNLTCAFVYVLSIGTQQEQLRRCGARSVVVQQRSCLCALIQDVKAPYMRLIHLAKFVAPWRHPLRPSVSDVFGRLGALDKGDLGF
eukprot:COSAG02_NODE_2379_length_8997_cov_13.958193_5_plen_105_part_00